MVLNDWSATEGVGPGNAAVTPKTPKRPSSPAEPANLVMSEGKGSTYQFQTIRKKLEDKRKDIDKAMEKFVKFMLKMLTYLRALKCLVMQCVILQNCRKCLMN